MNSSEINGLKCTSVFLFINFKGICIFWFGESVKSLGSCVYSIIKCTWIVLKRLFLSL